MSQSQEIPARKVMFHLTHKELLELAFWLRCGMEAERAQLRRYVQALKIPDVQMKMVMAAPGVYIDTPVPRQILEIGTGPHWGLLPFIEADLKFGVDPLYPAYEAVGILEERNGIRRVDEPFEHWDTDQQFDLIVTTNALDHGEMGFYLLPKIWRMLKPGGRFYLHVHLRPQELKNLLHDHPLTEEQLDKHLGYTDLIQERRELLDQDLDGFESKTLIGVWRKPE